MKNIRKTIKAIANRRRIKMLEKEYRTSNRLLIASRRRLGELNHQYAYAASAGGYYALDLNYLDSDIARANEAIRELKENLENLTARLTALRA